MRWLVQIQYHYQFKKTAKKVQGLKINITHFK